MGKYAELIAKYGSQRKAAKALGIPRSTFRYKQIMEKDIERKQPLSKVGVVRENGEEYQMVKAPLPGFEITHISEFEREGENGTTTSRSVKTRLAGPEHEKPDDMYLAGMSVLTTGTDDTRLKWYKYSKNKADPVELAKIIKEALTDTIGKSSIPDRSSTPDDRYADSITFIPLPDWHFGLLTWHGETGESWDMDIHERVIMHYWKKHIDALPVTDSLIILGLGDMFHSDNMQNMTQRSGNVLDVDGRFHRNFKLGVKITRGMIDYALTKFRRIIVRFIRGNHDDMISIILGDAIEGWYSNTDRVVVDTRPDGFWVYQHGKVMLTATHGDQAKLQDFARIAAARYPEIWGKTIWRYGHTGHIHKRSKFVADETNGFIVESHQTIIPTDQWHYNKGYGAYRAIEATIYSASQGIMANIWTNIITKVDRNGKRSVVTK